MHHITMQSPSSCKGTSSNTTMPAIHVLHVPSSNLYSSPSHCVTKGRLVPSMLNSNQRAPRRAFAKMSDVRDLKMFSNHTFAIRSKHRTISMAFQRYVRSLSEVTEHDNLILDLRHKWRTCNTRSHQASKRETPERLLASPRQPSHQTR